MSVTASPRKAGPYACNGSDVNFVFAFKVFKAEDVRVVHADAFGAETDLTLTTEYSVALNPDQDTSPGGSITTVATYPTGETITLTSKVAEEQPVVITNMGGFYPRVINDALDRLTILIQQAIEQVGRAVKVNISSSTSPDDLINDIFGSTSTAVSAASAASTSASAALASENKAAEWAENPEDDPVEPGEYSAKHHALKAAASAAGVNLPSVTGADAGKPLVVNPGGTGYAVGAFPDNPVPLISNVNISVESSPSGPTQFATIKAALDHVRATYVPAGGRVNITLNKTTLTVNDRVSAAAGEDLSHVILTLPAGTYTGVGSYFFFLPDGARAGLELNGAVSLSSSLPLALIQSGAELVITGYTNTLSTAASTQNCVSNIGGTLRLRGVVLSMTSTAFTPMHISGSGRLFIDLGSTLSITKSGGAVPGMRVDGCGVVESMGTVTISSPNFHAISVTDRASCLLAGFTASVGGGWVGLNATDASLINLTGSTATCNLTDNTISANGILIR